MIENCTFQEFMAAGAPGVKKLESILPKQSAVGVNAEVLHGVKLLEQDTAMIGVCQWYEVETGICTTSKTFRNVFCACLRDHISSHIK